MASVQESKLYHDHIPALADGQQHCNEVTPLEDASSQHGLHLSLKERVDKILYTNGSDPTNPQLISMLKQEPIYEELHGDNKNFDDGDYLKNRLRWFKNGYLGGGNSGEVFLGLLLSPEEKLVAVKLLKSQEQLHIEDFEHFHHPHVTLQHPLTTTTTTTHHLHPNTPSKYVLYMAYFPLGALRGAVHSTPAFCHVSSRYPSATQDRESVTLKVAQGISLAVDLLHSAGYTHRDLKPDNILLEYDGHGDWHVKVR